MVWVSVVMDGVTHTDFSRRPLEVGLVMGSRLHRIRRRRGTLELAESSGTHCQAIHGQMSRSGERIG